MTTLMHLSKASCASYAKGLAPPALCRWYGKLKTTGILRWASISRLVCERGVKRKTPLPQSVKAFLWWEQRESNPRPSACKADALNQLSYAPFRNVMNFFSFIEEDCKGRQKKHICKYFLCFLKVFCRFGPKLLYLQCSSWGCFGFDSIWHWTVSTSGVVGLPVNLSSQTISWQQHLCTRCVVYQVASLNPCRQGCGNDEYPSDLYSGYGRKSGYHPNRMHGVTPLSSAKI